MRINILTALASIALFIGATISQADYQAKGEDPRAALADILRLHREQNWEALVRKRCLDIEFAGTAEGVARLVGKLREEISNGTGPDSILLKYEAALEATPKLAESGTQAIFIGKRGTVTLSRMDSGLWGLRL